MWTSTLNFYLVHLFLFILGALVFGSVLYASNSDRYPIEFVDALFLSTSCVTGTGLSTTDLSALTGFQQSILFMLQFIGSPVTVSWVVVTIRRRYFLKNLEHLVNNKETRDEHKDSVLLQLRRCPGPEPQSAPQPKSSHPTKLHPDMIHRLDTEPRLIHSIDATRNSQGSNWILSGGVDETGISATRRSRPAPHPSDANLGGFHNPVRSLSHLFRKAVPGLHQRLARTLTMPNTATLIPQGNDVPSGTIPVPYLSFRARVGKNSVFHGLSDEHVKELGGVEFRALDTLFWIIPAYYFVSLAVSFVIITPYMAAPRWHDNFVPPQQHRVIPTVWFSAFQIIAAWANTGLSLVDQNMIPFQRAYPMIFLLIFCILAGNTAYPIFLRLVIWTLSKVVRKRSKKYKTLRFLLDHPRRCAIYLFPSRQTWLLFSILVFVNATDWFFFLVLDIGNPAIESIPVGTRIILGLLQAFAVRTAGFQSVNMDTLAPAVKFLYVVMMYISVYPIAMSVRSTNVYEEKSLGVYGQEDGGDSYEGYLEGSRVAIWGNYLLQHSRMQLSFDMWWLALALFVICIIERGNLNNPEYAAWFNIFKLTFELVSAYGTVGLSLGIPNKNYSFSGALHPVSKIVLCAVMIRGRHRGLPVRLDRAIMLPNEFLKTEEDMEEVASHKSPQHHGITLGTLEELNLNFRQTSQAVDEPEI